jgi:hypothetical protein
MNPKPLPLVSAVVLGFALVAGSGRAEERVIETRDLRLVYPWPTANYIAEHTVRCFENSMSFYRRTFDYAPYDKVTVMLNDYADYSNAAVWGAPRSTMMMHLAPPSYVYETGPSNERINFLMNHELAHVVTLDQASGDAFFRHAMLGKVRENSEHPESILYGLLTLPRRAAPRWHREGTAVFMETWMAGGLGRAQGPYDEMVFRSMVRDTAHFYDPLGLESAGTKVDFQVGVNAYLYGTRFSSWLADTYGPHKLVDWVARRPGSRAYYAAQFHHVYGRSLTDAWRDWVAWEHTFQRANLDSIRRHPTTPFRDLSPRALGSVSQAVIDTARNCAYAAVYYPGEVAHLAAIPLAGGPLRKLREVRGPALYFVTSLAWDPASRTLFYTTDNNEWRELCAFDPDHNKSRVLQRDSRVGDLAFDRSDSSLWAVRHFNGISTLVRYAYPWNDYVQVAAFPYGREIYDLDISPNGRWLAASTGAISGRHALRLWNMETLRARDTTARTLYDFGTAIPTSFTFSADSRRLHGSSYRTGASNIFRYDLEADSMDVVSNAETGFFRPRELAGDSLLVFRYAGGGFVPAVIQARPLTDVSAISFFGNELVQRHPELRTWRVASPLTVNVDSVRIRQGVYRPWRAVRLVGVYPIVEGYEHTTAIGVNTVFEDPTGRHHATASFSVTPQDVPPDERFHTSIAYFTGPWQFGFRHHPASFYDLVGSTKTSRKGTNASVEWSRLLIRDLPREMRLDALVDGWIGLERLPYDQNVSTSPGFEKLLSGALTLTNKNLRSSIGSVDTERGYSWNLGVASDLVRFERPGEATWNAFPSVTAGVDAGTSLLMRNASLWLRTAAGWSAGDRDEPFANFYFGGFGNNGIDRGEVKRYRRPGSFPGLEIDEVAGTNYGRAMLDWNLPPLRFERAGTPGFYASWARLSIFSTALVTNVDDASVRRNVGNLGTQLDLRLQLLTQNAFTLSGGFARAFEKGARAGSEWMVSLKVL